MSKLKQARSKASITQTDLIDTLFGSHQYYKKIQDYITKYKSLFPADEWFKHYEMSREDQIKFGYQVASRLIENKMHDFISSDVPTEMNFYCNIEIPGSVSAVMVRPAIDILGSEEQKKKWLPLMDSARCIGAYAQTELGHGSDVQNLQTEAVFSPETNEFVIHNRDVSSYKWWPGELGFLSSVVILYCKTIVNGKNIGVLPFIVPIRDLETHEVLKGVNVGDIGPKFGFAAKENGYLYFDNYCIPKENLLSRFFSINTSGKLIVKGNPKIIYASMMKVRILMLSASGHHLGKGLAIAVRYSHLRQQFKNQQGEEEIVMNYQLQQHKLLPLVAKSYAIISGYQNILKVVNQVNEERLQNKFTRLQECHILLAGAKALYTAWCNSGLVTCLQCCGGHGFSSFSGIPPIITSAMPNAIMEGDVSILFMQVGRYLMKSIGYIQRDKLDKLTGHIEYLKDYKKLEDFNVSSDLSFFSNLDNFLVLFRKCAYLLTTLAVEDLAKHAGESGLLDAFNKKSAIKICEAAKVHSISFTLDYFIKNVQSSKTDKLKTVLFNLASLFAIDQIFEYAASFIHVKVLTGEHLRTLKDLYESLLEKLLPEVLVLSEGFVPDEFVLYSAIADSNEKPYDNLYNLTKRVTMTNQVDLSDFYLRTIRQASLKAYPKL